jgi:uncharacterized membrane protein YkvA (DUF1232 family)
MLETIRTLIYVGGGLLLAFLICVSLPQSKLREVLMPVIGWGLALFCGVYVISPLDIIPDVIPVAGWIDDAGAIAVGIGSALAALNAKGK